MEEQGKQLPFTPQAIEEWKQKHGRIYMTEIDGSTVVWRKLRRREYSEIMADNFGAEQLKDGEQLRDFEQVMARQYAIVEKCAIWPENIDELLESSAGIAVGISDDIMLKSGFEAPKTQEL